MPPHKHPYTSRSLKALFDVSELSILRFEDVVLVFLTGSKLLLAGSLLVSKVSFKPEDNWQIFSLVKYYSIVHINQLLCYSFPRRYYT